ncbi:four helix bundle protein [Stieleria neptunia]|uniref:four helix bundle protein n=1 Tax=Stieleria neptunia TaxID=2527979 RepID=UPI0011A493EA|nr:four helix bundle protein [Stieleria neptunia]
MSPKECEATENRRIETLPDRKQAAELTAFIMEWTMRPEFRGKGDLANPIRRATLSISNHVAEAISRGLPTEMLHYIDIAEDQRDSFDDLKSEILHKPRHLD